MRLFVALEIPSAVRENLANLLQSLRAVSPQTKWVRPENLHVTLKFIGEPPQAKLAGICGALAEVRSEHRRLKEKLRAAIQENAARDFGSLRASQFHLIESKLKSSGAEYTTVESFSFAAAEA